MFLDGRNSPPINFLVRNQLYLCSKCRKCDESTFSLKVLFHSIYPENPHTCLTKELTWKICLQKIRKYEVLLTIKISSKISAVDLATVACFTMENCNETNRKINTTKRENTQIWHLLIPSLGWIQIDLEPHEKLG